MVVALGLGGAVLWRPWQASGGVDTADIAAGRSLAEACTVCHALAPGAPPRVGPHLWGIVDRPIGDVDGFGYSRRMSEAEGRWTFERLDRFLADPAAVFPGTSMTYRGLADGEARRRLIAYLATLGD